MKGKLFPANKQNLQNEFARAAVSTFKMSRKHGSVRLSSVRMHLVESDCSVISEARVYT